MQPRKFRITLAYDGSGFWGYAQQPGLRTLEGTLRAALAPVVPDLRRMVVGGRTDRGVHATGQVVSFQTRTHIRAEELAEAVDRAAPAELWCLEARRTVPGFHAQFWARGRRYLYLLPRGPDVPHPDRMEAMLSALVGTHDFHAYARDTPKGRSTVRRLEWARVRTVRIDGVPHVRFDFGGQSFLRHQVRIMVATVLREAAEQDPRPEALKALLELRDRTQTEPPAPPGRLYLAKIVY